MSPLIFVCNYRKSVSFLLFKRIFQWKHLQVDIISYEMLEKLLISKIKIKQENEDPESLCVLSILVDPTVRYESYSEVWNPFFPLTKAIIQYS
jgi:hypothetical protein